MSKLLNGDLVRILKSPHSPSSKDNIDTTKYVDTVAEIYYVYQYRQKLIYSNGSINETDCVIVTYDHLLWNMIFDDLEVVFTR